MTVILPQTLALALDDVLNAKREHSWARDALQMAEHKLDMSLSRLASARATYLSVDEASGKWVLNEAPKTF